MITIVLKATLTSTNTYQSPYTCTFSTSDTCVSFATPTVSNIVLQNGEYSATTEAIFTNEACFSNAVIQATFTDAAGCSTSGTITATNPCSTLNLTLSQNGDFVFIATATGGTPNYTYQWTYDESLFSSSPDADASDNILSLSLLDTSIPASTEIQCTVTDNKGCQRTTSYTYTFCKPSWLPIRSINLTCGGIPLSGCTINPVSQRRNFAIGENLQLCSGQQVDWSTLNIVHGSNLCVTHNNAGVINVISNSTSAQSALIKITVKTTSGILSNELEIVVNIPECTATESVNVSNETTQLTANNTVGTAIVIPTSQRITGSPNYSTMQIVTAPSFGTASINPNADIVYTPTDLTTTTNIPDIIKWSIQSTSGKTVQATETILRDAIPAPVAVNDIVCTSCGESTGYVDILANDTGNIVRDTVYITLADADITTNIDANGDIEFIASPGASFNNQVRYKVKNSQGVDSNEGVVFVSAACTGTPQSPLNITCFPSKVFDLIDYFDGYNAFSTAFVEDGSTASPDYTTQGGTITGGFGTVNFTSINPGIYRFKFTAGNTGSCPGVDDEDYITIINNAAPSLTITGITTLSAGVFRVNFTYTSLFETFAVTDNGSPANFQQGVNATNGSGTFNIYSTTGNTILISANTVCGTAINDTVTVP